MDVEMVLHTFPIIEKMKLGRKEFAEQKGNRSQSGI
mgnify:CR=1 FL=1